ncbi:hypothetical protein Dda_6477 [Drechslerella dactyloides]|uniref:LysM domain-containing protein n=1 Tax=Drechslerella dactyloides TaxID=74499 RepID=A0AAD6IU85_DREDA|nr:hypothetical protein Dda_6477 [Drechslerella dactyloides]
MASEEFVSRQQRLGKARMQSAYQGSSRYLNRNPITREWGPSGAQANPEEPRKQNLRAALLTNNVLSAAEQQKRRSSLSSDTGAATHETERDDVLVYVHNVQPTDTLARVLLIYDIEPEALRKANRLWPNDNIQMRSQLYLPIHNCAAKGIPLASHDTSDNVLVPQKYPDPDSDQAVLSQSSQSKASSSESATSLQKSNRHHSFVHIDPIGPIEIIRLAKPKLSHFPPATNDPPTPDPQPYDGGDSQEIEFHHLIGGIAKESLEGLEVVGAAIETFVRRVTRITWVNKTTSDLIELTSQIGGRVQASDDKKVTGSRKRDIRAHRPGEAQTTSATTNSAAVRGDGSDAPRNRRRTRRLNEPDS